MSAEPEGNGARGYSWPPAEPGNTLALKHGAFSERQIRPVAARQKRRVLRQMRTRVGDLSPVGRALLEHYCRTVAKVVLIDEWVEQNGLLRDDGTPQPCMGLYVSLMNTATRTLVRLEAHLDVRPPSLEEQLDAMRRSG